MYDISVLANPLTWILLLTLIVSIVTQVSRKIILLPCSHSLVWLGSARLSNAWPTEDVLSVWDPLMESKQRNVFTSSSNHFCAFAPWLEAVCFRAVHMPLSREHCSLFAVTLSRWRTNVRLLRLITSLDWVFFSPCLQPFCWVFKTSRLHVSLLLGPESRSCFFPWFDRLAQLQTAENFDIYIALLHAEITSSYFTFCVALSSLARSVLVQCFPLEVL